jgi:hypothetical protein
MSINNFLNPAIDKIKNATLGNVIANTGKIIKDNRVPILWIGGATVATVLVWAVVKKWKSNIEGESIEKGRFNVQEIDFSRTTISQATANNYAEILFEAFNYSWGTDKSVIEMVFKKIKPEDFKMIYNAFGKRSYSTLNDGSPSEISLLPDTWLGNSKVDLITWIDNELDFIDGSLKALIRKVVEPAGFVIEK